MKTILHKKLVIFFGVVVLIGVLTAILIATGALKFSFYVTKEDSSGASKIGYSTNDKPLTKIPSQETKLATRAVTFKNADFPVEFSINLPLGWATAKDDRVDFVAGSATPEKLEGGKIFYANINAIIGKHPTGVKSFLDYKEKWKDGTLKQYPSMEFLTEYTTTIDDMDVYVYEVSNTRPDGLLLRQIQYVFYVDKNYALIVTVTAPLNSWISYEDVVKKSVESIKLVSSEIN